MGQHGPGVPGPDRPAGQGQRPRPTPERPAVTPADDLVVGLLADSMVGGSCALAGERAGGFVVGGLEGGLEGGVGAFPGQAG